MRGKKKTAVQIVIQIFLMFLVLFQLFPLIVLLLNSFRTDIEIKNMPIGLPKHLEFSNYIQTWVKGSYAVAFCNSIFIGVCVIVIVLIGASLAAYGLARLNIPGKGFFIAYFMLGMSFPTFLYIVPLYYNFSKLGLINTQLSLIIIYSAGYIPFSILLIRTFLVGIPKELEEAGKIDGCGEIGVFLHVTLPLLKPILTTVSLIVFVWCWNEFLWSNTFITADDLRTVATRFYKFTSEWSKDLAKIYTAGIIALSPIVVLYLCLQKAFIEGLTQGAVKG